MRHYDYGSVGGYGPYDIVGGAGDTEIVGAYDDYETIVGQGGAPQAAPPEWMRRKLEASSAIVRQEGLSKRRRFPLGFDTPALAAAATSIINAAPQNLFRGDRLCVPSNIAFDYNIRDLKVGNESQFVSGSNVPAACFTEVAQDTHLLLKTAEIGNQISVDAENISTATVTFRAALFGIVAR